MDKTQIKELESRFVTIPLDLLEPNEGQLEGLPANPRKISESKFELLKENIMQYPEMLELRRMKVYPLDNGHYIVIDGNMRLRAMQELGHKDAPCVLLPKETTIESLQAYATLGNVGFGKWDWDMLANEWDAAKLSAWGVDLFICEQELNPDDFCSDGDESKTKKGEKITIILPEKLIGSKDEMKALLEDGLKAYEGVTVK